MASLMNDSNISALRAKQEQESEKKKDPTLGSVLNGGPGRVQIGPFSIGHLPPGKEKPAAGQVGVGMSPNPNGGMSTNPNPDPIHQAANLRNVLPTNGVAPAPRTTIDAFGSEISATAGADGRFNSFSGKGKPAESNPFAPAGPARTPMESDLMAAEIMRENRMMRNQASGGGRLTVVGDSAQADRDRRRAMLSIDDSGDGLRPRGAYGNLLAVHDAKLNAQQDASGGLRRGVSSPVQQQIAPGYSPQTQSAKAAAPVDPIKQMESMLGLRRKQMELSEFEQQAPYREASTQQDYLDKDLSSSDNRVKSMGDAATRVAQSMGFGEGEGRDRIIQSALNNIIDSGEVQIGLDKDGNPVTRDFMKLSASEQNEVLRNALSEQALIEAMAGEIADLGGDPAIARQKGFLDSIGAREGGLSWDDVSLVGSGYNAFTNLGGLFGDTGLLDVDNIYGEGAPGVLRLDNVQKRLKNMGVDSSPALRRIGSKLRDSK